MRLEGEDLEQVFAGLGSPAARHPVALVGSRVHLCLDALPRLLRDLLDNPDAQC